ncbi:MAG: starch-binding protein [Paludibacteraceae bacterium]|nr:starch-binding protein [Paludibacteraceae bacterium]
MKKSIFLFFAALLCALSVQAKNVYAVNYSLPGNGSNTYCHNWQNANTNTTSWPGTKMTKLADIKAGSCDIYYCTLKAATNDKVIFSSNGSSQSSTFTLDSKYPQPTYANGSWWYSPRLTSAIWGDAQNVSGGYIYFDNTQAQWNDTYIYLIVGHDKYLGYYRLTKLEGTNLYYASLKDLGWGDAKFVVMAGHSSSKSKGSASANTITSLTHFSDAISYGLNTGTSYMITMESGNNCTPISIDWNNDGYEKYNHTQTIYKVINDATTTIDVGTVEITTTKLSGNCNGTKDNSTAIIGTSNKSATADAVQTAVVTLQASAKTGYKFLGWAETADGTIISTNATYTYTATSEKSYYAKFQRVYSVTITNDGNGTTTPTTIQTIAQGENVSITATAATNYEFVNWEITSGSGSFGDAHLAETTFTPTSDATVQANFRSTLTYSLTVQGGTGIKSVSGDNNNVTLGESYDITATLADGYVFEGWTADVAANAEIADAAKANTSVVVKNGSVVLTASATEIMSALTTSNTYDEGTPSIDAPATSVSEIGITTTATITAATDIDYTLASWTLENCVRTDGGADNATTITVKSNGDGAAATVTANYNIIPKITLYFVNSTQWEVVACHHWKEGVSGTIWPGDLMEKVSTVHGFDIYKVKFTELEHDQCIFNNNNNGKQTGNLAVQDGKYYYPETDEWYATVAEIPTPCTDCSDYAIAGSMNDWSARRNRLKVTANNDIVELTLELTAGDYDFKVAGPDGWYGNSGKYEREHSGNAWTYRIKDNENNDEDNARIYVDMTGEYTFTWKISTKELTITYPELPDFSQQTNTILFRPSTDWKKSDARFAAYFFGATAEKWVDMTDADGDGIYEATNPKTNLSVKICCLKSGKTETKWENVKWRSINYEIPTGVENCWVVNDGAWDDATGTWAMPLSNGDNSATIDAAKDQKVTALVNRSFVKDDGYYTLCVPFNMPASLVGKAYQISGLIQKNTDYVEVNLAESSWINAGAPYLIVPSETKDYLLVENVTIVETTGESIAKSISGLSVAMQGVINGAGNTDGLYWVGNGGYLYNDSASKLGLRTYFNITTPSGIAPRLRVVASENVETGIDNIVTTDTPVKVIENGQLIIIRDGIKYNVQGQKL